MEFRILGSLEALDGGRGVALAGAKQRALLAVLLLHANETLSSDELIEELWGEHPPATAAKTVQVHVSRLRKALAAGAGWGSDGAVVTRQDGYRLELDPEHLDAHRFERLLAEARSELADGRPQPAISALEEALSLWRGGPLHDLAYEPFAQREIARLEELHVAALEELIEAKLALGRHAEVLAELGGLVAEHPYRERLRAQLMLALYRCDRQADALQAYQDARRALVDELGIEPGERLRELERAVLAQDPTLATPSPAPPPRAGRVPVPPTRTIGRDEDRDAVSELLREEGVRLVTLIGPGGVGKTRLALEVASALEATLPDGAWFVSLASTASAEHVPGAIVQAMGIVPSPGESAKEALERFLAAKRPLLVLDNFEHLLPAASLVGELMSACAALKVLATSREALRLQGEHCYGVDPLDIPGADDPATVARAAAGALFVERARGHDRRFELTEANAGAIAGVCRRLDGLPLAVELAAARTRLLGADELNSRLARALDVLGGGARDAPDRQHTLRATIDWSHRLLDTEEARAFARFAVFAGGATIEAAQEVTGAELDTLEGLIDKQLLRRHGFGAETRLLMLETIREYARERLEADEHATVIRARHCRHYLTLAARAEPELYTRGEPEWLARLDAELDNLRAALEWSLLAEPTLALRLAGLLSGFWKIRNLPEEGVGWLEAALGAAGDGAPLRDRARGHRAWSFLLIAMGSIYDWQGSKEAATAHAARALALSRQAHDPKLIAEALLCLASHHMDESGQRSRRALAEEAVANAHEAGDPRLQADALAERALTLPVDEGAAELEVAATALRRIGNAGGLLSLLSNAGYNAVKDGKPGLGGPWLEEALRIATERDNVVQVALVQGNIGLQALFTGKVDRASIAFHEQLRVCRQHVLFFAAEALAGMAAVAARGGDDERAAQLLGAATATGPWDDADAADVAAQLEDHFFAPARRRCGQRRWSEAYTEGAQLTYEEAIELALAHDVSAPSSP